MPLKLSVGLTKKIGQPDYGSIGASCHVEVELDGAILRSNLDGFHEQVRTAFAACRQAVSEELSSAGAIPQAPAHVPAVVKLDARPARNRNGSHVPGAATDKQLRYVRQLAGQITGIGVRDIDPLCQRMFEKPMAALSGLEMSALIDMLKGIKDGHVKLEDALSGASQ